MGALTLCYIYSERCMQCAQQSKLIATATEQRDVSSLPPGHVIPSPGQQTTLHLPPMKGVVNQCLEFAPCSLAPSVPGR